MRKIAITILAAVLTVAAQAQKVTFTSEGIEAGVRHHLGLDANADILQSRADTITAIDLSGLGITDLSDIVYLPNVRTLDLSDNNITNVGPLNVLDSLSELNLKKNALESINLLAFSNSYKMMVDVTGIEGVKAGDVVTLLGRDGEEEITADTLGSLSGRFPYELVCCVNKRVPRIYTRDGKEWGTVI